MDKRLEEQLERVWRLSERVARIHEQLAAQNTELRIRDRARAVGSPLPEVRDLRQHSNRRPADRAEATDRCGRRRRRRS
jgi:hypothetical protein